MGSGWERLRCRQPVMFLDDSCSVRTWRSPCLYREQHSGATGGFWSETAPFPECECGVLDACVSLWAAITIHLSLGSLNRRHSLSHGSRGTEAQGQAAGRAGVWRGLLPLGPFSLRVREVSLQHVWWGLGLKRRNLRGGRNSLHSNMVLPEDLCVSTEQRYHLHWELSVAAVSGLVPFPWRGSLAADQCGNCKNAVITILHSILQSTFNYTV